MMPRRTTLLVFAGLALVVAGAGLVWYSQIARPVADRGGRNAPLSAFDLTGARGPLTADDFAGHWTFLFLGYTHCPDVCPTSLSLLKRTKAAVTAAGAASPAVIFISVDPARDTPAGLDAYVRAFDADFSSATGTDDQLFPLVRALDAFYQRDDQRGSAHYTVDHTADIYLIDPERRVRKRFPPPQDAMALIRIYLAETKGKSP